MKQLLHALYITEPDVVLRKEGESLLAVHGDGQKDRIPLHLLEQVVSFSGAAVSPAVITAVKSVRQKIYGKEGIEWAFLFFACLRA